jgi:alkanesulfonate monooxygenase SsuD/methylene tetrahydromethanopterin reductase-like flavin-dependent oxidoreductase (luciferase family)
MRWGVHLPVAGKVASPGIILQVAVEAERIGLDSVWSWERLMRPMVPRFAQEIRWSTNSAMASAETCARS